MYRSINDNADAVTDAVSGLGDVAAYFALRASVRSDRDIRGNVGFQRDYRRYWRMNAARLDESFYDRYFETLDKLRQSGGGDLSSVAKDISDPQGRDYGLQFSFATKLLHMVNPRLPVYDSFVAAFYFYATPSRRWGFDRRLADYIDFHDFLKREYARVLKLGLLAPAIVHFRGKLRIDSDLPDERVVDWLLWAWVSLLRRRSQARDVALFQ